jgi:lipoprotein NlpI
LFVSGRAEEAVALATQAIQINTNHVRAWFMRGRFYQETDQPTKALGDFTEVTRLDQTNAPVWAQLGTEHFKLADFEKSLECFDRFLAAMPEQAPRFWQRGIVAYHAGKYETAMKQFELYRRLDTNDVEVVVWQYLCTAKLKGLERARLAVPAMTDDVRIPMTEINRMFAGTVEPSEVLRVAAIDTSKPPADAAARLNEQMFYAHFYVGLYYEARGQTAKAAEHIGQAALVYRVNNFMGVLARVHFENMPRADKPTGALPPAGSAPAR